MNLPFIGGQKDRKIKQEIEFQEQSFKKLREWELTNNILVSPVLMTEQSSLSARILFTKLPQNIKEAYENVKKIEKG